MMKKQIEGGITYKNPKGFTLIELLAVIVILAVIALILTPIVSGIIKTAKKNAFESTGYGILESTKLYYSKKVGNLESDLTFTCNNDTCTSDEEKLEFKGNINGSGTVLLFRDGNIALCLESEDYATIKNINDERLSTTEQGTCEFNEETKEYAVIGTVSARDYEILQNQYNSLNNGKDTLVNSLNNKGLISNPNLTLEEMALNIDEWPVTFGKDENGNYGYIKDENFNTFESGARIINLGSYSTTTNINLSSYIGYEKATFLIVPGNKNFTSGYTYLQDQNGYVGYVDIYSGSARLSGSTLTVTPYQIYGGARGNGYSASAGGMVPTTVYMIF